jgi:hypothetical protein
VADRNEAFRQRVEDPMFMVSQKERQKRTEAQKQQALFERVIGPASVKPQKSKREDSDSDNDSRRKKKKSRKRERKERRRRDKESRKSSKKRDYSDDYDSEE